MSSNTDCISSSAVGRVRDFWFAALWGAPMGVWLAMFFVMPLGFLFLMSFWSVENFRLSANYNLKNWSDFFSIAYFRSGYFITVIYAAMTAILAVLLSFPLAYTLAFKVSPATRRFGMLLLFTPFFTSYLMRAYSWQLILASNGIANNVLGWFGFDSVTLLNTPFATFVGYLSYTIPIVSIFLLASLTRVDRRLIEAAHNLGEGRVSTVFRVIVPASKIGIVFAALIAFILSFSDFIAPSILGGGNPPTLSILIIDTIKSASNWPSAATVAISMIVTLLVVTLVAFRFAFPARRR